MMNHIMKKVVKKLKKQFFFISNVWIKNDTPDLKILNVDAFTKIFYDTIRSITNDVTIISKNTNIPEDMIQRIKNHIFLEEHIFRNEIGRFAMDEDIAAAWQRLIDNKFIKSDLILLQHEHAEALIMNGMEIPYNDTHYVVNQVYNWENLL